MIIIFLYYGDPLGLVGQHSFIFKMSRMILPRYYILKVYFLLTFLHQHTTCSLIIYPPC